MDEQLLQILRFAQKKHSGQIDMAGEPYILHPIAVALLCTSCSARRVALLHDVLEDTDTCVRELYALGLTKEEVDAVVALTRLHNENYMDYIQRVGQNPLATEVKLCDLIHNMDLTRLPVVDDAALSRVSRYRQAYQYLNEVKEMNDFGER